LGVGKVREGNTKEAYYHQKFTIKMMFAKGERKCWYVHCCDVLS
jgi:hypothetical protein